MGCAVCAFLVIGSVRGAAGGAFARSCERARGGRGGRFPVIFSETGVVAGGIAESETRVVLNLCVDFFASSFWLCSNKNEVP